MRLFASIRNLFLAALLAASHVVFASHVTAHANSNAGNCEWCVGQAQTMAGPLPVIEPVAVERFTATQLPLAVIPFLARAPQNSYQSRAPPAIA